MIGRTAKKPANKSTMKDKAQQTLNRPFEAVTVADIKTAIVGKFGSLSQFCRITGRDVYEMNVRLRCTTAKSLEYQQAAFADAKRLCNQPIKGYQLTPIDREKLKAALGRFETITAFCEQNTGYSSVFISRVTHGATQKITPKVKALAKDLGVELEKPETGTPAHV